MSIELKYINGRTVLAAVMDGHLVCHVEGSEGEKVGELAKKLVSKFLELQNATIEALNATGIIHYVKPESLS